MTKKILTIIFSVIIIGVFAFLLTWGIINWSKVKEGMAGNGLYTQDDINNAFQDGYDTAIQDKDEYESLISGYRDTITTLTDNISQLNSEISTLTLSNNALELQILNLTQLKISLEEQLEDLQLDKTNNEAAIAELNNQIIVLNTEIAALTLQVQNHNSVVSTLNKTIADLQASIDYYEQYIASLETGETVVVTFEFDGKVYNIQVVNKGSTVTVTTPTSTEYVIFNGWTVDGHPVNLSEYPVNANTKFVADITYKYIVNFSVDGVVKSTQIVEKGHFATVPSSPKKANYTFKYWTLDGSKEVQIEQHVITCDTTFIAKFARLFNVSFVYEDTTLVTRRIEENTTTNPYHVDDTEYKVFNGWTINGVIVDVANYRIVEDTTFVASITYYYKVTFMIDDRIHDTQIVKTNDCATLPTVPKKDGVFFDFWTLNKTTEIDVEAYRITAETTFIAKFYSYEWKEMTWKGMASFEGDQIWTDGVDYYYSAGDKQYVLNRSTNTWSAITWKGCTSFYNSIWTDGTDIYLSWNSNNQYVLNRQTRTWTKMTWNGYNNIAASHIWTDGVNIYYSYPDRQYVLDVKTRTWTEMKWNGKTANYGEYIWTDGTNYYYSNGGTKENYVLDVATHTWSNITWDGRSNPYGDFVWTDGTNCFYSGGSETSQYLLDKDTNTWIEWTWNISYLTNKYIWTDGTNFYYSKGDTHYILKRV